MALVTRHYSVAARLALALLLFFTFDSLAFRTGWYVSKLEPNSTAGFLMTYLRLERQRPIGRYRQVLGIGDSRLGLKTRIANAFTTETGCAFGTIAVPGTTPRCWYYMLREVDPRCDRYDAIVIPFDSYDDRAWEVHAERELDLNYLTPLLRVTDFPEFVFSYPHWENRAHAAEAVLLKGFSYQHDFLEFIDHPKGRLQFVRLAARDAREWYYNAAWERRSLAGIDIDWGAKKVSLPDWLTPEKRRETEHLLLDDPQPISEDFRRYRLKWLGKILDRYRGSRTRFLFIRLPRGPVVRPQVLPTDPNSAARQFVAAGRAVMLPEHTFDPLERPELFGDALHLNEGGGCEFSEMLARQVGEFLGSDEGAQR